MSRFLVFVTLCLASAGFAQTTYTIIDLGTLTGTSASTAAGINASGQVAGVSADVNHAFVISPPYSAMVDLGTLGGGYSVAYGINDSGQVTGSSPPPNNGGGLHAFVISPPYTTMIDLPPWGPPVSDGRAINASGQITGASSTSISNSIVHAFLTSPPYTTMIDLGTFGGGFSFGESSEGLAINASGQVTGIDTANSGLSIHAFLISPPYTSMIDLDPLGVYSVAYGINDSGQVTGTFQYNNVGQTHAFLISPPYTTKVDLGDLGGPNSYGLGINGSGQVVGKSYTAASLHAFLYTPANGMVDLNTLLPSGSGWTLLEAVAINDAGQIAGDGISPSGFVHAFLLTPVTPVTPYKAFIQQPINADGTSVFSAKKGVVPIKFTLTLNGAATCTLPPATIAVTRTAGGTVGSIDESTYSTSADTGSNFRIDATTCQYIYNLAASSVGAGSYRVDISINGSVIGHAVFGLK